MEENSIKVAERRKNYKKRIELPLSTKLEIIHDVKNNPNKVSKSSTIIAAKFNISRRLVAQIWKDRDYYLQASQGQNCLRMRRSKTPLLDKALVQWIKEQRARGIAPSGRQLKNKSWELAAELGMDNFTCSNGWYCRFRKRYSVKTRKGDGVYIADVEQSRDIGVNGIKTEPLQRDVSHNDVYTLQAAVLYYLGLPDSYADARQTCQDRVTIVFCANKTGIEKRQLLVVGKQAHPVSFPDDLTSLPVVYRSSSDGLLNDEVICSSLKAWNAELILENKKIILVFDSSLPFPENVCDLTNIEMYAQMPDNDWNGQPANRSLVRNFKGFYRWALSQRVQAEMNARPSSKLQDILKHISLLECVHLFSEAWECVSQTTIAEACTKAGIVLNIDERESNGKVSSTSGDDLRDVPVPEFLGAEQFEELVDFDDARFLEEEQGVDDDNNEVEAPWGDESEDVDSDADVERTNQTGTDDSEIVSDKEFEDVDDGSNSDSDKEGNVEDVPCKISTAELFKSLRTLKLFTHLQGLSSDVSLAVIEKEVYQYINHPSKTNGQRCLSQTSGRKQKKS